VLKVGSASLTSEDCKLLKLSTMCALVECICTLKQRGYQVVLVTSGAVAFGCQRMGLPGRPPSMVTKQAVAAIGQSRLMRVYDDLFSALNQPIAQVLLTRENMRLQHHYRNALNTLTELLRLGVVPIINENDTVSQDEIRIGDNDSLSAMVASLVQAKWLFLLTDVDGLYDCDPRDNPQATLLHTVSDIGSLRVSLGSSGAIGTGGMTTKLTAASIASAAGVHTGIIRTTSLHHIGQMMAGERVGTHFLPSSQPLKSHKRFIAHGLKPEGAIVLDNGASDSILQKHSLFSAGVVGVQGTFAAGTSVRLLRQPAQQHPQGGAAVPVNDAQQTGAMPESRDGRRKKGSTAGASSSAATATAGSRARVWSVSDVSGLSELGVCLINYSADEVLRLAGHHSTEFADILGYEGPSELANRDNIALTAKTTHGHAAAAAPGAAGSNNSANGPTAMPVTPVKQTAPAAPASAGKVAASVSSPGAAAVKSPGTKQQEQPKDTGANKAAAAAEAK